MVGNWVVGARVRGQSLKASWEHENNCEEDPHHPKEARDGERRAKDPCSPSLGIGGEEALGLVFCSCWGQEGH